MKRKLFVASGAAAAATAAAVPRYTTAAGPVTVKIGFLESFSGVFSDIGGYHRQGAVMALADANRKGRVRYEFSFADDASAPATAGTEARRLITQEKVDVLMGGTSSANGLALAALTNDLGIFNLSIGPQDSSLTGAKATSSTYRFGPNVRMLVTALSRRALALGQKWFFIQADYAFGKDAYAQLSAILAHAGGTEVGHDVVKLGTTDFSSVLTKVRNSDANVLMLANSGLDAANTIKQAVQFGVTKKCRIAGVSLEDIYANALPLDQVVNTTFPVLWAPEVSDASRKLAARFARDVKGGPSGRHYLGYMAATTLCERLAATGTTKADALVKAFDGYAFDAFKENRSRYNGDHQCAQDTYAGATVSAKQFAKTKFMFDIVATVPAAESDGNANSPWQQAAKAAIAAAPLGTRSDYQPKTL
jgi:branched-chain amino acid transport system substrate-binding protein